MLESTDVPLNDLRYILRSIDTAIAELEIVVKEGDVDIVVLNDLEASAAIVKHYLVHKE